MPLKVGCQGILHSRGYHSSVFIIQKFVCGRRFHRIVILPLIAGYLIVDFMVDQSVKVNRYHNREHLGEYKNESV